MGGLIQSYLQGAQFAGQGAAPSLGSSLWGQDTASSIKKPELMREGGTALPQKSPGQEEVALMSV